MKKDVIAKMRKDPSYVERLHMRVLDGQGHEIDPRSIDWSSDRAPNFTIRQDSGNWNALGAVRIDMPNPYSVYMHDTSHKEFFSADYRFQSSGCTRVEDPRALASWLLSVFCFSMSHFGSLLLFNKSELYFSFSLIVSRLLI